MSGHRVVLTDMFANDVRLLAEAMGLVEAVEVVVSRGVAECYWRLADAACPFCPTDGRGRWTAEVGDRLEVDLSRGGFWAGTLVAPVEWSTDLSKVQIEWLPDYENVPVMVTFDFGSIARWEVTS
jgi:hypothetical protein